MAWLDMVWKITIPAEHGQTRLPQMNDTDFQGHVCWNTRKDTGKTKSKTRFMHRPNLRHVLKNAVRHGSKTRFQDTVRHGFKTQFQDTVRHGFKTEFQDTVRHGFKTTALDTATFKVLGNPRPPNQGDFALPDPLKTTMARAAVGTRRGRWEMKGNERK